ncbi:hypothetical protein [Merismopedia glauca]|uniref:Uncharacterized protein n=1 Tax=Merismopedia glauca CCAP 1448/3 TaxID=1296344 RepID=A0A2T1C6W3_9CYAN|nr:hypothetical protein [Merismopedia glauca]PSB03991.1 hypothetical protein C7B64_05985 [Merismopedia glauca CCAP 1448/3]
MGLNRNLKKIALERLIYSLSIWLGILCLPGLTQIAPEASEKPLEINLLQTDSSVNRKDVLRGDRISATTIQVPSLWWTKEQFDPFSGRLINNWLIYTQAQGLERRVDILVNFQLWGLLDYIERYTLVNKFGTVGREYGYNIRVFNGQKELLAAYTCNLPAERPICNLWIEPSAQDSLQRGSKL